MSSLSKFESRGNNRRFKFNFEKNNSEDNNFIYITKEKYEELYLEIKKVTAFVDSSTREFVRVKNTITTIKLGVNDTFREENGFVDRDVLITRAMINEDDLDNVIDYPFSLNYDNFFTRTNRIDVFANVSKIQRKENTIDSLKGFKSNSLGNSNSAFGQNLKIKNFYEKDEESVYHFEDNIIETFLYNNKDKNVVDKIIRKVNPITREQVSEVTIKKKNIVSGDTRYFAFREISQNPYVEKSYNENEKKLSGKQNRYVFTDSDINNKILTNRNINSAIKESFIYASRGLDCDHSMSSGIDSLIFNGRLD